MNKLHKCWSEAMVRGKASMRRAKQKRNCPKSTQLHGNLNFFCLFTWQKCKLQTLFHSDYQQGKAPQNKSDMHRVPHVLHANDSSKSNVR